MTAVTQSEAFMPLDIPDLAIRAWYMQKYKSDQMAEFDRLKKMGMRSFYVKWLSEQWNTDGTISELSEKYAWRILQYNPDFDYQAYLDNIKIAFYEELEKKACLECQPIMIDCELHDFCDYKCVTCQSYMMKRGHVMDDDVVQEIFETLIPTAEIADYAKLAEPFLLKDRIINAIQVTRHINPCIHQRLYTHGERMDADIIKTLVDYEFENLNISIDGSSEEGFRSFTQTGHLHKVVDNIVELQKYKRQQGKEFPRVTIVTQLTTYVNPIDLMEIAHQVEAVHVAFTGVVVFPANEAKHQVSKIVGTDAFGGSAVLSNMFEQCRPLADKYGVGFEYPAIDGFPYHGIAFPYSIPNVIGGRHNPDNTCPTSEPWYRWCMSGNGLIGPCCHHPALMALAESCTKSPHLPHVTIREVWNHPALQGIRTILANGSMTSGCECDNKMNYDKAEVDYTKLGNLVRDITAVYEAELKPKVSLNVIANSSSGSTSGGCHGCPSPAAVTQQMSASEPESAPVHDPNKKLLLTGVAMHSPCHIEIDPITVCNLRCVQCHNSHGNVYDPWKVDLQTIRDIRDYSMESDSYTVVTLAGAGEFFLHKEWRDILEILNEGKCDVEILTNGISFGHKDIDKLWSETSLKLLQVSMDAASSETFYNIRGSKKFDRLIDNLKYVCAHPNRKMVRMSMVVMKENMDEIIPFIHLAKEVGANGVLYQHMHDRGLRVTARSNGFVFDESQRVDKQERKNLIEQAYRSGEKNHIFIQMNQMPEISLLSDPDSKPEEWEYHSLRDKYYRQPAESEVAVKYSSTPACWLPWLMLNRTFEESWRVCCMSDMQSYLGGKGVSVQKAWNSEELQEIRRKILRRECPKQCLSKFCSIARRLRDRTELLA